MRFGFSINDMLLIPGKRMPDPHALITFELLPVGCLAALRAALAYVPYVDRFQYDTKSGPGWGWLGLPFETNPVTFVGEVHKENLELLTM